MDFDFRKYHMAFKDYAKGYADSDGSLPFPAEQKSIHTDRVVEIASRIMEQDKTFTEKERALGMIAALFHDVSRFEQYRRYETFRDNAEFDHGLKSAEIMLEKNFLHDFTEQDKQIVANAIRVHNKITIPENFPENAIKTAKLTRDADKLAIIHLIIDFFTDPVAFLNDKTIRLDMPDTPGFSFQILQDILDGKNIYHADMRNMNDFKLTMFAWVNDFNFPASAEYALEKNLYPDLRKFLPESDDLDDLLEFVQSKLTVIKNGQ